MKLVVLSILAVACLVIGIGLIKAQADDFEERCERADGVVEYLPRQQYLCLDESNTLLFRS